MTLPAVSVQCPYCGEPIELLVDAAGDGQHYIEDCPVCCRPMDVHVDAPAGGDEASPTVRVTAEDDI